MDVSGLLLVLRLRAREEAAWAWRGSTRGRKPQTSYKPIGAVGELLHLWMVSVPNTQTLPEEAHNVMAAVWAFWQELYGRRPLELLSFRAVVARHMPQFHEGAWAQVQQYAMQSRQSSKASNKAFLTPVQWLLVHSYRAFLRGP